MSSAMHKLLLFQNQTLLLQALTHRSYWKERQDLQRAGDTLGDNERLEFLGDAILNFVSAQYLYHLQPQLQEDEMTRRRSALVDEHQLAKFALDLGIDRQMRLGPGTIKNGGYQNPNLLSSTFEAVVGAYYLDQGQDLTQLRPILEALFNTVPPEVMAARAQVDVKNQLQQFIQAQGITTPPNYSCTQTGGSSHAPEFTCEVRINGQCYGQGQGRSKKMAEKIAASIALQALETGQLTLTTPPKTPNLG